MKEVIRLPVFMRNVLSNWSAFLVTALVGFILSPFVVRSLGVEAYGVWVLLGSLVGYLGLLDLGVRGAVMRYVAQHHEANRPEESSRTVSAGLLLFGSIGLVAIASGVVMAFVLPDAFDMPEELVAQARAVILIGTFSIAVALVGGVFGGVVTGLRRFDVSSGIEIVVTGVRATAVVLALRSGQGLVALAFIQLLSSLLIAGSSWVACRRIYPELRLSFGVSLRPEIRELLVFGAYSSLINASAVLMFYTDTVVVGAALPVAMVTIYSIAASLCEYAKGVVGAVTVIMAPEASALQAKGMDAVERAMLSAASLATLITGSIVTTFWLRGESFINLWMGAQFGATSGDILVILGTTVLFGGARSIAVSTMMGLNQHRIVAPVWLAEAISNLALSIVLVRFLGLVGVAIGTLIPNMIVTLGILPGLVKRATGLDRTQFYRAAWVVPLLCCVPFAAATALVERYFPAANLLAFFAQVGVLLPLVPLAAWGWDAISGSPVFRLPATSRTM
jgi:O-antigen/teichoic acid export membrane protein